MQDAITEILQLVADKVIQPEEGRELLRALRAGYPEEFEEPTTLRHQASPPDAPTPTSPQGRRVQADSDHADSFPGAVTTAGATPSIGPSPQPPIPAVLVPQNPYLIVGESIDVIPGVLIRIDATGFSPETATPLSSIAIRGVTGQKIRVVRGAGVELHKDDEAAWRLTWSGGMLFLEVPATLAGLEILGIPGSVGLSGYTGPFSGEEIGGGFTVHGAASPFRIRGVQGTVQLLRLALRDGISTVAAVSQNVEIETAPDASVTIRASLQTAEGPDGGGDLDTGDVADSDLGGRRGVWRVGAGTAQLNVSQVRGQLRLRPADRTESAGL